MQTFEFIHDGKTHNVDLTNGLIIDVEDAYGAPLEGILVRKNGKAAFLIKAMMAIYVGILNNLAEKTADYSLRTSMAELGKSADFNYSSQEVQSNCAFFYKAVLDQEAEWNKIALPDAKKSKKKPK